MSENVKVVSNFLAYDTEGNVTGIAGDMVHIFNKNESAVHDSPYFKKLEGRKNIVLMGDSLGDLQVDIINVTSQVHVAQVAYLTLCSTF